MSHWNTIHKRIKALVIYLKIQPEELRSRLYSLNEETLKNAFGTITSNECPSNSVGQSKTLLDSVKSTPNPSGVHTFFRAAMRIGTPAVALHQLYKGNIFEAAMIHQMGPRL